MCPLCIAGATGLMLAGGAGSAAALAAAVLFAKSRSSTGDLLLKRDHSNPVIK